MMNEEQNDHKQACNSTNSLLENGKNDNKNIQTKDSCKTGDSPEKSSTWNEKLKFWFAGGTAIATVVYAIIVFNQLSVMRGQLDQMKDASIQTTKLIEAANRQAKSMEETLFQNREALNQTNKLIEAADKQAKSMEEMLIQNREAFIQTREISRDDQRAWIGINDIRINLMEVGKPLKFEADLKNTGKTVALNCKTEILLAYFPGPFDLKKLNEIKEMKNRIPGDPFALFPGIPKRLTLEGSTIVKEEIINSIKSNTYSVCCLGEIYYSDIYLRSHVTEFCMLYRPNSNSFIHCQEYNQAN